ncbi:alginate export family protein [Spongiibacter sp. KMU-158]|uniref:Alginate export family protein n=1 Tax=Spongiibacter pelagi TaxID=2760804 RepID=A0A927C087_9GAMM|nr:alginate export family protein [Spongiibacter pelagi]MBD2858855.1 alginate export family protein [Spongiibacter pelagi]
MLKLKEASKMQKGLLAAAIMGSVAAIPSAYADDFAYALANGKAYGDFRLRYESVEQDNALKDATALTLRSQFGYTTGTLNGFSATIEAEDVRIVAGEGDYSVPPAGYKTGQYSVIADAETTELDQGFIQYKNKGFTGKLGRQVLTYDGHRFIGHVGWRQDKQTFDGLSLSYSPSKEVTVNAAYLYKRNRIFAEAADMDSSDVLFNIAYNSAIGKFVAYSYMLEDDATDLQRDTMGASFSGSTGGDVKFLYTAEYASQSKEPAAGAKTDTDYALLEGGVVVSGITVKLGYELLGSDDATDAFQTPLATMHKFNGWADNFLVTPAAGLEDTYLSVGGKLGGGAWSVIYHDFAVDDDSAGASDYGSEVDAVYSKAFGKNYYAGIKYAAFSADSASTLVDTDKLWVWVGAKF